ncbi:hypothetical protein D3C72_1998590 [compost metagenome]
MHDDVDPRLGHLKLAVVVDVDVEGGGIAQGIEVPAVVGLVGAQQVARGFGVRALAVVEVVGVRAVADQEVGVVAEVAAVALRLAEEQLALGDVGLVAQPLAGDLGIGQPQRQRQLA